MPHGGLLAGGDEWGGSGIHAAADRKDAQADPGNSRETGGELV
jgi:hypothetical protein